MAKINPKEHTDGYKDQKAFDRITPVKGTFDVMGIKMQWQKVGKKATEKLRIFTHVFKVVESEDTEGAAKMVGGSFGVDLWWNLYKTPGDPESGLNFNGQRLVNHAIACGHEDSFDPDDRDALVKILTGVPYRIKIDVEKQEGAERDFYNVNVTEVKHLSGDARKKYREAPDFGKILPKLVERRLEDADYSQPREGGKGGGKSGRKIDEPGAQSSDPFNPASDSDGDIGDLPFMRNRDMDW